MFNGVYHVGRSKSFFPSKYVTDSSAEGQDLDEKHVFINHSSWKKSANVSLESMKR